MKILYVEDELSKNIPRIIRLFSQFLTEKAIQSLQNLENDESGYGAEPEAMKSIVENSQTIDVSYRFPEALARVLHQHGEYALFIVDRNLVENGYQLEEVIKVDSKYSQSQHERFLEREGDYLLQKLVFQGVNVMERFYFLTAHSPEDEIRNSHEVETLISFKQFNTENFIEKGSKKDFKRLQHILDNLDILNFQAEDRIKRYYEKTLSYYSSNDPEASLWMARKTAEAMCRQIFERKISSNSNSTTTLDKFIELLGKQDIIPLHIIVPLRTIQNYGNYGTHDQGCNPAIITSEYAQPCIQALTTAFKWYTQKFYREPPSQEAEEQSIEVIKSRKPTRVIQTQ